MMSRFRLSIAAVAASAAGLLFAGNAPAYATPAAAPVYWTFESWASNNTCLTASAANNTVFTAPCEGWQSQQWDFIGDASGWGQHMLVSRTKGLCLTTEGVIENSRGGVWLDSCDRGNYKWWSIVIDDNGGSLLLADIGHNANYNTLRTSPNYDSVYTSGLYDTNGIPRTTHDWYATHS